jgi:hypothetical protein
MTEDRLPLAELFRKAGEGDFLRSVAEAVLQLLMEADAEGLIGAGRHERSPELLNKGRSIRRKTVSRFWTAADGTSGSLTRALDAASGEECDPEGFNPDHPVGDGH